MTIHLNPHPPSVATELIELYRGLPPATIGHLIDEGFVDSAIRPIFGRVTVVGMAVTVQLPGRDLSLTRPAINQLRPGDVLVIDFHAETQVACWGEMTSLAAKMKGCVGVIIDGGVTDVVEIEEQRLPTFARAVSAHVGRRLNTEGGGVNIPVRCGGVQVNPGDLVVADDNGIVVISPERAAELGRRARAEEDRAPHVRTWLQRGGALAEVSGKDAETIRRMVEGLSQ